MKKMIKEELNQFLATNYTVDEYRNPYGGNTTYKVVLEDGAEFEINPAFKTLQQLINEVKAHLFDKTMAEPMLILSSEQVDNIYRLKRQDFVAQDVINLGCDSDTAYEVGRRYSFEGDYDCNLSYWENLENLVKKVQYLEEKDSRIPQEVGCRSCEWGDGEGGCTVPVCPLVEEV